MQGIPPDVLAAHYWEDEEETPSKVAKVDVPPAPVAGGFVPEALGALYPQRPIYSSAVPVPPVGWPVPPPALSWPPIPATATVQPLQVNPPGIMSPVPTVPVSQTLFPVVNGTLPQSSSFSFPLPSISTPADVSLGATDSVSTSYHTSGIPVDGTLPNSHSYTYGPHTRGPSIGPPPVIANKASTNKPGANEVYPVWDDEAMSMEERRMSVPKYQVHDETSQMSSIDAAIDKRISESSLAGRMPF